MSLIPIADFVTDFADQAVLLPLAAVVAIVLALAGWWRGAIGWTLAIGAALALTLLLKLVFLACGHLIPGAALRSPSGHVAASGAIYGGLFAIVARIVAKGRPIRRGLWTVLFTIAVILVIAASRLVLGAHSPPEVLLGGAVALCGAIAVDHFAGPPPERLGSRPLLVLAILVMLGLHGIRMPAEAAIADMAYDVWPLSKCR